MCPPFGGPAYPESVIEKCEPASKDIRDGVYLSIRQPAHFQTMSVWLPLDEAVELSAMLTAAVARK